MQQETRSLVSVLRSSVTSFDRSKTKNGNCFEECNDFGNGKCELTPFKRKETKVQIFGKEKCKIQNENCFEECNVFGFGKCELSAIQEGSPRKMGKLLARKSAKLIPNFSATKLTSWCVLLHSDRALCSSACIGCITLLRRILVPWSIVYFHLPFGTVSTGDASVALCAKTSFSTPCSLEFA